MISLKIQNRKTISKQIQTFTNFHWPIFSVKKMLMKNFEWILSRSAEHTTSVEQLIVDALSEYDFPIAFNMPAGHEKDNRAMILGRTIQLTVGNDTSYIVFEN